MDRSDMTIVGNLIRDPKLQFTQAGLGVAHLLVAHTTRILEGCQWVDGITMFYNVEVWKEQGENVAASLRKGHRVIITGYMKTESYSYTDKTSGEVSEHSNQILVGLEVAASLKFAEVRVAAKADRT